MKSLRTRFEEEYAAVSVPADNKDGFRIEYVYYAPWYIWDLPEKLLTEKKKRILLLSALGLVIFLLTGVTSSRLNQYLPVILCTVGILCSFVAEISGVLQFVFAKYRTTQMTFQAVDRILRITPVFRSIALAASVIFSLYFLLANGFDPIDLEVMLGSLVCLAATVFLGKEYRKIPIGTEKNPELDNNREFL